MKIKINNMEYVEVESAFQLSRVLLYLDEVDHMEIHFWLTKNVATYNDRVADYLDYYYLMAARTAMRELLKGIPFSMINNGLTSKLEVVQ